MTKPGWKLHALSVAIVVTQTAAAAQSREAVWNVSATLTGRDQRDILELAATLGIRTPKRVVDNRSPCPLVSVSAEPVVDGNRVTTTVVRMRPRNGSNCPSVTSGRNVRRRGNWIAIQFDGNPRRDVTWRVRDGDWHRDLGLGPDVEYEDAEAIVRAIRHGTFVDLRSADDRAKQGPPTINPDQISSVTRFRDESMRRRFPDVYADMYEVRTATHEDFTGRGGGGYGLWVKVRDGRMEIHGFYTWMS